MFGIGYGEMILVAMVTLLLFGNRVPDVMRSLGRGLHEFKKGMNGIEDEIRRIDKPPASRS
jgi:sec-independent protein translocase protein TatA